MRNSITQEQLKAVLDYDPDTGVFRWKESLRHGFAGRIAGTVKKVGYVTIGINKTYFLAHRLAWLYVTGELPKSHIDHIDHCRTNNRFSNLRLVSRTENQKNATLNRRNKSGVSGVVMHRNSNRWYARIGNNGKAIHIGSFKSLDEAIAARRKAEAELGYHKNHGANKNGIRPNDR